MSYDIRDSGRNKPPVVIDDDENEIALPTKKEVCPACEGKGKHVNPNIDRNGLSAEDFAEDPDFAEDYFRGIYDVTCYVCGGANVIDVVDEARCDPQLLARYQRQQQDEAEYQSMCAAERRAECYAAGERDL